MIKGVDQVNLLLRFKLLWFFITGGWHFVAQKGLADAELLFKRDRVTREFIDDFLSITKLRIEVFSLLFEVRCSLSRRLISFFESLLEPRYLLLAFGDFLFKNIFINNGISLELFDDVTHLSEFSLAGEVVRSQDHLRPVIAANARTNHIRAGELQMNFEGFSVFKSIRRAVRRAYYMERWAFDLSMLLRCSIFDCLRTLVALKLQLV